MPFLYCFLPLGYWYTCISFSPCLYQFLMQWVSGFNSITIVHRKNHYIFYKIQKNTNPIGLVYMKMVCRKLHCILTRYKTKQTSQTRFGSSKYIKGWLYNDRSQKASLWIYEVTPEQPHETKPNMTILLHAKYHTIIFIMNGGCSRLTSSSPYR
jgi:hypothetical protein